MFKKTRLRILALIMAVAVVVIILMLSVIYLANSSYNYERGISLLESYTYSYEGSGNGMENPRQNFGSVQDRPNQRPGTKDDHNKMLKLSTFYSVQYDMDGNPVKVNCGSSVLYSEQEILEMADSIISGGKTRGVFNKMPYLVSTNPGGTIVALIDHTMEMDNSNQLFTYCLVVGVCSWVIILFWAWFFSKKVVDPLEQNDIKQKQFISDAGHELKTPISVISANADLLSMEIGENKWLSNIRYENERMGNLVIQLLDLVRAENMQQHMERLDLSCLVSGGTLPFESVAFENGQTLNTDIEDGIYVEGSRNQLSQLVSILIDNAIEHGERGKEISVKLCSSKHQAVLSVVNAGQPIPDEIKDRLFERFYRVDEARTEDVGHYGLGLAIAKAVVTSHAGRISLDCHDGLIEFKVVIPQK